MVTPRHIPCHTLVTRVLSVTKLRGWWVTLSPAGDKEVIAATTTTAAALTAAAAAAVADTRKGPWVCCNITSLRVSISFLLSPQYSLPDDRKDMTCINKVLGHLKNAFWIIDKVRVQLDVFCSAACYTISQSLLSAAISVSSSWQVNCFIRKLKIQFHKFWCLPKSEITILEANSWMKESILVELIRILLHCSSLKRLYSVCFDLIVLVPVKISAACVSGCVGTVGWRVEGRISMRWRILSPRLRSVTMFWETGSDFLKTEVCLEIRSRRRHPLRAPLPWTLKSARKLGFN